MNDQVLQLKELVVRYGEGCVYCIDGSTALEKNRCPVCGTVWAIRNVSLTVYRGEILGIVGESGSGKTTLMKALYLDLEPTEGMYTLSDWNGAENVFCASVQQRKGIRNGMLGMVYQNPHLGLRMFFSSGANIAEKLIAAGERRVETMQARTEELLRYMEVPVSRVKEPPKNFSGGMQQRVQIAKAIANGPPILLLDEVTTGLDLSVQAKVLDLILRIQRESGISMVVVSHDLAVIRMLCDRTVVMLNGGIVESGLTDQILEDPQHPYTQILVHSLL
jgi:putative phosphonate transport system ATP-binding protein